MSQQARPLLLIVLWQKFTSSGPKQTLESIRNIQPTLTTDFLHSPTGPDTHDIIKLEENGPLKHEDSDSVTVPDEDGFSVHSSGLDSADSDDETDLSEEMYPYYDTYVYIYEILFVSELEKITMQH